MDELGKFGWVQIRLHYFTKGDFSLHYNEELRQWKMVKDGVIRFLGQDASFDDIIPCLSELDEVIQYS